MLTLSERLDNESKGKEGKEDAVQFLEAGKDAPIALEAAEEPFDLIACFLYSARSKRQGSTRLDLGGTTGTISSARTSWRVSLPS